MGPSHYTRAVLGWGCCALTVALAPVASAPVASAQAGSSIQVSWSAPDNCGSAAQVEAQIRARTSQGDPTAAVAVDVRVTRRNVNAYRVQIRLGGALAGERRLDAESCDAAIEATALLVALALDPGHAVADPDAADPNLPKPSASTTAPPTTAADDANTPTNSVPTEDPPTSADNERADEVEATDERLDDEPTDAATANPSVDTDSDAPTAMHFALGGGVPVDSGSTPGITTGVLLSATLSIEHLLLTLAATALLPRETTVADGASLSARWMSAAFDGCYLLTGAIQWGPCVGVEAGWLASSTRGLVATDNSAEAVIFASGSLVGRAQLTPTVYAAIWLSMRTPISYPRLLVAGVGEVFRPAVLGTRASLVFTVVLG